MSRGTYLTRGTLLLALALGATACEPEADIVGAGTPSGGEIFRSYVALGNSITAGFQSSGINDSTQRRSYARLFAQQAGTRFAYPSLATPGCPPPVVNFTTQSRGGPATAPFTGTTCALRATANVDVFNNLAVPGALVVDLGTADPTPSSSILTNLILGGRSQTQRALEADPTFASVWIGNNDVLGGAVRGTLTPFAPVGSPGITALETFRTQYNTILTQLTAGEPELEGALIGVVQVSNVPLLFQVGVLLASPAAKAGFDQAAGGTVTIAPNCTTAPTTLVSFLVASQMRAGTHPRLISCGVSALAPAPVGEIFILTPDEQATLTQRVNDYNAHIQQRANELGWAYVDVNPTLAALKASGAIPSFPNLASTTQTFGRYISLDGVHPSNDAHVLVANALIASVNAKYGMTLTPLPVPQ